MKTELENELYKIDPIFFEHAIACQEGKENEMTTCMYFGCECGDGWFEPIKRLVEKTSILNNLAKEYNAKFVCDQLKEKFGEIRIYYGSYIIDQNKEISNQHEIDILYSMFEEAIRTCEKECWNVCEWCGIDGGYNGENLITTTGWISRICKKCAIAQTEKQAKHYAEEYLKEKYIPNISFFNNGYYFLNAAHIYGFKYNEEYYNSIIEAFYCCKDEKNKKLFQKIGNMTDNKKSPYLIEDVANTLGLKYEDNNNDYELMKSIIKAKFTYEYNKDIKQDLLETKDKILYNNVHNHNNILGCCICNECKDKEYKNLYAKMLTEVRDELLKEKSDEK